MADTRLMYTKQDHLMQWLRKLSGDYIPTKPLEPIIPQIRHCLDSNHTRHADLAPITGRWYSKKDIRWAIRQLNVDDGAILYQYVAHIQAALTGSPLPVLSAEQYEQCVLLSHDQLSTTNNIRRLAEQVIKRVAMPWKYSIKNAVVYCLSMGIQVRASGGTVSLETQSLEEARNRLNWLRSRSWIQSTHTGSCVLITEEPIVDVYIAEIDESHYSANFSWSPNK